MNRFLKISMGILIVFLLLTSAIQILHLNELRSHDYSQYQKTAHRDRKEMANQIAKDCTFGPSFEFFIRSCLTEKIEAYHKKDTTNKDLQAQQDMAYWAFWLTVISAIGTFISLVGLAFLWRSLLQTGRAIRDNREIGIAETRAYIGVDSFEGNPHYQMGNISTKFPFEVGFSYTNNGATPAHNVRYTAVCEILDHPIKDGRERLIAISDEHKPVSNSVQANATRGMDAQTLKAINSEDIASILKGEKRIYAIGTIVYDTVFNETERTDFCIYFECTHSEPERGNGIELHGDWFMSERYNEST